MNSVTTEELQMLQHLAAAGGRFSYSRDDHQQQAMANFAEVARSLEDQGLATTFPYELNGQVHLVPVEITDRGRRVLQHEHAA